MRKYRSRSWGNEYPCGSCAGGWKDPVHEEIGEPSGEGSRAGHADNDRPDRES